MQLTLTDSKVINNGQWHHVAAVITIGQGASIYVDGALSTTQSSDIQAFAGASPLLIGLNGWVPYGTYFNGTLDDTRLYNRILLASEIITLATPGAHHLSAASGAFALDCTRDLPIQRRRWSE